MLTRVLILTCSASFLTLNVASAQTPSPEASASPSVSATGITVVPYEKLLSLLPEPPAGWTAENPNGSTTETDELHMSTAQRSYYKGDADDAPTASVTIIDPANNQGYLDATTSAWQFKNETAEGYDKAIDIDGMKGFEHYSKAANSSSLSVFVGNRFFIQIELTNTDPKELRAWLAKIDLKKLEALR